GKAHAVRFLAVGALVDGHAPAGVVVGGLVDERVLRFEQGVTDRDRLAGYRAEYATHDGGENAGFKGFGVYESRERSGNDTTEAHLVGAAAQAVRAGAARR